MDGIYFSPAQRASSSYGKPGGRLSSLDKNVARSSCCFFVSPRRHAEDILREKKSLQVDLLKEGKNIRLGAWFVLARMSMVHLQSIVTIRRRVVWLEVQYLYGSYQRQIDLEHMLYETRLFTRRQEARESHLSIFP